MALRGLSLKLKHAAAVSLAALLACGFSACEDRSNDSLTFAGSALGAEGAVINRQLSRFQTLHPEVRVGVRITPESADQRHQLYVQWLNGHSPEPDVLQLDTIWTAEFAAAEWLRPLSESAPDIDDFFPAAIAANRWRGTLYALPLFVDTGLLYWRTDLFSSPPDSLERLRADALAAIRAGRTRYGLVWQGARYEGLVTVFLEYLGAFGGRILDANGGVELASPEAVRALTFMREAIWGGEPWVPASTLGWQEEPVRFAFQNGQAAFMRNWPYAWQLLQDPSQSRVSGRVAVAPFPGTPDGSAAAALGGAELAVNRFTRQPRLAAELVAFLTDPAQMLERARLAAQLPARRSVYAAPDIDDLLPAPADAVRHALEAAIPRPVTPVYSELSEILQVHLHRALSRQREPADALADAARDIRELLARASLTGESG